MTDPLLRELTHHEYFRHQLKAQFPEADEETLDDTLEGLTDLRSMLGQVIRSVMDDKSLSEALQQRIEAMQARLKRLEHRMSVKRALVAEVMERATIRQLVEAEFSASLRTVPPPLLITDETAVPASYWLPQPPKLDRKAVGDHLRQGATIPGAVLGNGGVALSVRVR